MAQMENRTVQQAFWKQEALLDFNSNDKILVEKNHVEEEPVLTSIAEHVAVRFDTALPVWFSASRDTVSYRYMHKGMIMLCSDEVVVTACFLLHMLL